MTKNNPDKSVFEKSKLERFEPRMNSTVSEPPSIRCLAEKSVSPSCSIGKLLFLKSEPANEFRGPKVIFRKIHSVKINSNKISITNFLYF